MLLVMHLAREWRRKRLSVCYTIDVVANVHVICSAELGAQVAARLQAVPGVR